MCTGHTVALKLPTYRFQPRILLETASSSHGAPRDGATVTVIGCIYTDSFSSITVAGCAYPSMMFLVMHHLLTHHHFARLTKEKKTSCTVC
jgi:hypothetical protein